MNLPYSLERTITIEASPETVFRFFTDSARWAAWWGAGSSIEPRPGGAVKIRYPGGIEVLGEVLEIAEGERIAFTYGYASGQPIPPGASRVTITLRPVAKGTELTLAHGFADEAVCAMHMQGWRFQLSLFGNAVADEVHANATAVVDGWYAAWMIADTVERDAALAKVIAPGIQFRDRFSLLDGADDLSAHIAASQRFMPGISLRRKGSVRQCQGTALAEWVAVFPDGMERMSGTSVFRLQADGRIESAVGIANA
jgi:uncharacterized protein YndB with AHSA1/START domain